MRVRGSDLWPAPLTRDLVDETHHGHRLRGYPRDARTLGDVLGRAAARVPDRDAVVTRERRLTWRELRAEVDRMAGALHARHGVKPGDRVALLLLNSIDFCVGVFACARLGAVAVTLNTKLRAPELEFMLQNSGARILIMHEALWDEIAPIRATVPCEAVYVAGRPPAGTEPLDRLTDTRERPPAVVVDEDDTAFIMYTSGTTRRPKGALGTHVGIVTSSISLERCMGLGDGIVALREWLPQATLQNAYGMTETSSPTTLMPFGQELARISSVGWPVPIAELRTVDVGTGRECAADEVGELCIRGPHVVPGYWANPEATAATMGDGWMRSGDLARIDADGYVTIMDRLKDMINRGGEKIYCVEVEDVLCAHPAVLEAAVVGVADPVYGEAVKACVVPRAGGSVDPDDVRRFVPPRLPKFKVPREIAVLDALPRNPNGKVIKSALR